jgi:hypothetical protein
MIRKKQGVKNAQSKVPHYVIFSVRVFTLFPKYVLNEHKNSFSFEMFPMVKQRWGVAMCVPKPNQTSANLLHPLYTDSSIRNP